MKAISDRPEVKRVFVGSNSKTECDFGTDFCDLVDDYWSEERPQKWTLRGLSHRVLRRAVSTRLADWCDQTWAFRQSQLDAIVHCENRYRYGKLPVFSWIGDFQHLHMPNMFSSAEVERRTQVMKQVGAHSTGLLHMSHSVQDDFNQCHPEYAHKSFVVPIGSFIPQGLMQQVPEQIAKHYNIPKRFFYLPNQFWKHKNHGCVVEALRIAKSNGCRPFVVCTGRMMDFRHVAYAEGLLRRVSKFGVRDQIAFLGLVPRDDMVGLMRQCISVLNPSHFEGYGLSVNEAKTLGVRVIASDLPSHREINHPAATYFHPDDPEGLAALLESHWTNYSEGPNLEQERLGQLAAEDAMTTCARAFVEGITQRIQPNRFRL